MTDSPRTSAPLDPKEQPILDRLLEIRTELELLKSDKSKCTKSQDVIGLYEKVIEQVVILNDIRTFKRTEQNRVDSVLDSCLQLISLAFLTIGKNSEAPAIYSAVSTIKRLLDHLKEVAFFSNKDLESICSKLKEYRSCIERGKETYSPHLVTLLEARIEVCRELLAHLQTIHTPLGSEYTQPYEKVVSIMRCLSGCNTKCKFPAREVDDLQDQLIEVEKNSGLDHVEVVEGASDEQTLQTLKDIAPNEGDEDAGRKTLRHLLSRCFIWINIMRERQGRIDERFRDTYDQLRTIRNKLDNLQLTHAWSLRETDLYSYQRQLDRIDESRVDGNFLDALGRPADLYEQRTMLYLLRKSYALIYLLIISSEPVSEALMPIYNQLLTLRRCLEEVTRSGGVSSPRELYPYSMKLNSIDNMRVDGKFMVGSDIPDGQGAVSQLLAECFDMAYRLRVQAEHDAAKDSDSEAPDTDAPEIKSQA